MVRDDPLHQTLAFLGDTDETRVDPISSAIKQAVHAVPAFDLPLRGLDVFGPADNPRVLLTRPGNDAPGLSLLNQLADRVRSAVHDDLPPDRFGFTPHITLARTNNPLQAGRTLAPLLAEHAETDFGVCRVDAVKLYESELGRGGPRYELRVSVPLSDGSGIG